MSTSPHISRVISLSVTAPETRLVGGPEMFLDTSSGLVNLTCIVEALEPPKTVTWYHNTSEVERAVDWTVTQSARTSHFSFSHFLWPFQR